MFERIKLKPQLIDLAILEEMTDGSPELLFDMIDIFMLQVSSFTKEMDKAYHSGDYAKLGAIAHKAKSSVATMGITSIVSKMKEFELLAKSGENPERYPEYLNTFKTTCKEAIKELLDIKSNL